MAEVTHWPETDAADCCGDGLATATSSVSLTMCRECTFWHKPATGLGIQPIDRRDEREAWWRQAGYCVRHAPFPSGEAGWRGFWRATHATDGCAEGKSVAV